MQQRSNIEYLSGYHNWNDVAWLLRTDKDKPLDDRTMKKLFDGLPVKQKGYITLIPYDSLKKAIHRMEDKTIVINKPLEHEHQ